MKMLPTKSYNQTGQINKISIQFNKLVLHSKLFLYL